MKCANENYYSIIRIKQTDIYNNRIDWKSTIIKYIKKYDDVTNIFINTNKSYDKYIDMYSDNEIKRYKLSL